MYLYVQTYKTKISVIKKIDKPYGKHYAFGKSQHNTWAHIYF